MLENDELVRIIHVAAAEVFTLMLGSDLEPGNAYTTTVAPQSGNGMVSLIGLTGACFGSAGISCTADLACRIASQFLMSEYTAVNDDVLDAMAEITNMIIGNVKTALEEKLGPMGLSIPTVIYGRNFSSRTVSTQQWTIVPFVAGGEGLEVRLCLVRGTADGPLRPSLSCSAQFA